MTRLRFYGRGLWLGVLTGLLPTALLADPGPMEGPQVTPESARIQGVLLNQATLDPIAYGLIRLVDASGEVVRSVASGGAGRFSVLTPGPGAFSIEAERLGFETKTTGQFSVPSGHVLSVEVHLFPAPQDTASALIQGTVLDEATGTPVAQALVRLLTPEGEVAVTVESNGQGRFSLRTPGPGAYRLQVSALGYQLKESGEFAVPPGHVLTVEMRLAPSPLPLDSVEVVGRRRPLRATEQLILGRLLDYTSGEAIPQGVVRLLKAYGSRPEDEDLVEEVLSDNQGVFSFITPLPGTYRLRGERIGYRTSDSPNLHIMPGDSIILDFFLDVEAVVLDPITVRASARPWADRYELTGMDGFFYRQSRFAESGFGSFLTRDSIASYEGRLETNGMLMASVMEVRMVNTEGGVILAHGCNPRYYLDGMQIVRGDPAQQRMVGYQPSTPFSEGVNPELLYPPESLEAVEVYLSPTIPSEFSEGYPCGVVALWTRRR